MTTTLEPCLNQLLIKEAHLKEVQKLIQHTNSLSLDKESATLLHRLSQELDDYLKLSEKVRTNGDICRSLLAFGAGEEALILFDQQLEELNRLGWQIRKKIKTSPLMRG